MMPEVTLEFIQKLAPQLAEKLKVSIFVESAPAIRALAESGHGYAVVPSSVLLGKLESRMIKGVPIRGLEVLRHIATLRGRPRGRGMRELAVAIRLEFARFIGDGLMRSCKGKT